MKRNNHVLYCLLGMVLVEFLVLYNKGTFYTLEPINLVVVPLLFACFFFIAIVPSVRLVTGKIDRIYRQGYRDGRIGNKNEIAVYLHEHFPIVYKELRKNHKIFVVPNVR